MEIKKNYGRYVLRGITISIVLDKRTNRKDAISYPVSLKFAKLRKWYYPLGLSLSEEDFHKSCVARRGKSEYFKNQQYFDEKINRCKDILKTIGNGESELSIDDVKIAYTGKTEVLSFLSTWEDIIKKRKVGTASTYNDGLQSFMRYLTKENKSINGFCISIIDIKQWIKYMKDCGNTIAYIGKNLRTCRVIWNECIEMGYLQNVEYPFKDKEICYLMSVNAAGNRSKGYLCVDKMQELYNVFVEQKYNPQWSKLKIKHIHYSLGLFLAQYLCNGCNLIDLGLASYNNDYFQSEGKCLSFERHKTEGRSDIVIKVPITEPLEYILNEIASEVKSGGRVFSNILHGISDSKEQEIKHRIKQENKNITNRMGMLCEWLGWSEKISNTWARHSFATNLRNEGVSKDYISCSMGHSIKTTTDLYLDEYTLEERLRNNSLLLRSGRVKDMDIKNLIENILKNLSAEEKKELLSKCAV